MGFLKNLLSFVFPFTEKRETQYSGTVDVTTMYGEVTLDTENANYSYGSLQRILKKGLKRIDLTRVESVLLLGVAGGSVIQTLRKDFAFEGTITGIEIDPELLHIADEVFGVKKDERTDLIVADAFTYVYECKERFDLIIVDLFIDNDIPEPVYDLRFWDALDSIGNSTILFNTIIETAGDVEGIAEHLKGKGWSFTKLTRIEGTNDVLILYKENEVLV